MANINSMFITLNVNSSPMDVLNKKIEAVTSKLVAAASSLDKTMSKMMVVSNQAAAASSQLNSAGSSINKVSKNLVTVSGNMDNTTSNMSEVSGAAQKMINDMSGVGTSMNNVSKKLATVSENLGDATTKMEDASGATKKFNKDIEDTGKKSGLANNKVVKLIKSMVSMENIGKGMELYDNFTNTTTQLGSVTDKNTTKEQLQDKVFAAANRSRGNFTDMAGTVTSLERSTGDLFGSNDETIAFTELTQKSLVASGATPEERKSGMDKMTDVMAAGKLDGGGLQDISQTAPLIYEAIAEYTGKSGDELMALADAGKISSGDIKNAMFAMGDEINANFESIPLTFIDIGNRIRNEATRAFTGVAEKINGILKSDNFMLVCNNIILGFYLIGSVVSWVIDLIGQIGNFFSSNWGIIEPVIWGIVAALIVYNATMGIAWLTTLKSVAAKAAHIAISLAETTAILALILAQDGFNAALAACPVTWIIYAIIALIVIFYAAVGAINKFAGTSISATGLIAGAFMWILSVIGNIVITVVNLIIDIFGVVVNFGISIAEYFKNVFNDPVGSVIRLFGDLADTVLGIIETIASAIDTLFGSNLAGAISGWRSELKVGVIDLVGEAEIKYPRFDSSKYKFGRFENGKAWDIGYNAGADFEKSFSIDGMLSNFNPDNKNKDGYDMNNNLPKFDQEDISSKTNPLVVEGTGSGGSVNVDMPDEDISFLREIAERDYIANIASNSLAPNISIKFGDVHENADAEKIAGRIQRILQDEIAIASEGVY